MVMIIGLCGKMGSGKDYIAAKYIVPWLKEQGLNYLRLSFADQIKVNVMAKHQIPFDDVFVNKNQTTRVLLQQEGTENGRNVLGKNVWINYFDTWCQVFASRGVDAIVACDVRFKNEACYIKAQGGILIKVVAPARNEKRLQTESCGSHATYAKLCHHSSECDLDDLEGNLFNMILNNDFNQTIDEKQLENVLQKYQTRQVQTLVV
jgi:hypothetical protein